MKRLPLILFLILVVVAPSLAATTTTLIVTLPALGLTNVPLVLLGAERFSDYTNRPAPLSTDIVLLADPVNHTNAYVTWAQLLTAAAAGAGIIANPWDTNSVPEKGTAHNSTFTGNTTNNGTAYFPLLSSGTLGGFGTAGVFESYTLDSSFSVAGTTISVGLINLASGVSGTLSDSHLAHSFTNDVNRTQWPTNLVDGVDIDPNTSGQLFITNATFTISGFKNFSSAWNYEFDITFSNSAASSITINGPANTFYAGTTSTNATIVPAGKEAYYWIQIRANRTNIINGVQQ